MTQARTLLENYLCRIGLTCPADSALHFQVTLLRQWIYHLDAVLDGEELPWETRRRIITSMIYGGAPHLAEAEVRASLVEQTKLLIEQTVIPRPTRTS